MKIKAYACDYCADLGALDTGERYPYHWIVARISQQGEGVLDTVVACCSEHLVYAVTGAMDHLKEVDETSEPGECEGQEQLAID
jgi:hypothetical protein